MSQDILGADICGVALPFLEPAIKSAESVVNKINVLKKQFTITMWLLGISSIKGLLSNDSLISESIF